MRFWEQESFSLSTEEKQK